MSEPALSQDDEEWRAHYEMLDQVMPLLKVEALQARYEGLHHSDFKVGAAALAYCGVERRYRIFTGCNCKPEEGSEGPRVCAEEEIFGWAKMKGCSHIIGFVIAAPPKADDQTGADLEGALLPCKFCRRWFQRSIELGDPVRRRTRFVSMCLDLDKGPDFVKLIGRSTIGGILDKYPPDMDGLQSSQNVFYL